MCRSFAAHGLSFYLPQTRAWNLVSDFARHHSVKAWRAALSVFSGLSSSSRSANIAPADSLSFLTGQGFNRKAFEAESDSCDELI
jgi:hypothetical protein